jgi:hypothetical protein
MRKAPQPLSVEGVEFPLEASANGVRLAVVTPALDALQLVLARLSNPGVSAEQRGVFSRGEDFAVPNLSARRIPAADPGAAHAIANWRAFAAREPGDDLYLVSASFAPEPIAVPRATMIQLMAELWRLCEAVRAGQLEPLPSAPLPAPPTVSAAPAAARLPAGDAVLVELEGAAALLDQLDPEDTLRAGPPGEALDALTAARRRTILLGLRTAGLLGADPEERAALRRRLVAMQLPTLLGYLDAASALRAYATSEERAALLPPASDDLLRSAVSLDWFRKGSPAGPAGLSPARWLAQCEAAFLRARPVSPLAGRTFIQLGGIGVWLHHRSDLGPHVSLWRAVVARGSQSHG